MLVALLVTCVADLLDPDVAEATAEVLSAGGCDVAFPTDEEIGQAMLGEAARRFDATRR